MTTIYYRRIRTFSKYPFQDEIETDMVYFSKSKKEFEKNIFLELNPQISDKERKSIISECLKIKAKNINLERY